MLVKPASSTENLERMLNAETLRRLACPQDGSEQLSWKIFRGEPEAIVEAVVVCEACRAWFPVEDGIADFLIGELAYADDRARFWHGHENELVELGLAPDTPRGSGETDLQRAQQRHFDWYSRNETQTYDEYERLPFWVAADGLAFSRWRSLIRPRTWLLDVGCGPGRATAKLVDLDIDIVAFDVSKAMVRLASERFQGPGTRARTIFMTADAMHFPIRSASFDYVMAYGVLHHVPDPPACAARSTGCFGPAASTSAPRTAPASFAGCSSCCRRSAPSGTRRRVPKRFSPPAR